MAISIDTKDWLEARKAKKVTGSHYWTFKARGQPVGDRRFPRVNWSLETDGPWDTARQRALESARETFGVTADVTIRLVP